MKLPLKADLGKGNCFGFITGAIRDADGNVVMSGAFVDRATAKKIVACLNAFCETCGGLSWNVPLADYCQCEKRVTKVTIEGEFTTPAPPKPSE